MAASPYVSVVIPCRNESRYVRVCLDAVLANDYPRERFEVLVVDGASHDGTRDILREYARQHSTVRVLENPKGFTPISLNMAVRAAKGSVILRMDAHARIAPDYIRRSVEVLEESGADNVGGVMHTLPRGDGLWARAVVRALSHRFGVGNSYFRVHPSKPRWVDTVFGGCYRREVFGRIGLFNEELRRSQDIEFNLRLKKAGGRILLHPDIASYYYYATDFRSFCRHSFGNGEWVILPFNYSTIVPVSWRHLVPGAFAASLVVAAASVPFWRPGAYLLGAILASYAAASFAASVDVAVRDRGASYLAAMPAAFATLHACYGAGTLYGLAELVVLRLTRKG